MLQDLLEPAPAPSVSLFGDFADAFLPDNVPDDLTARLLSVGHPVAPSKGSRAFIDPHVDHLVFIAGGAAKLVATASQEREQIVAFHFAGDLVSLPANVRHDYSLVALQDSQMLAFPAREFLHCARYSPALLLNTTERMMLALYRCRDNSVGLGKKNAEERLAGFLTMMAERIGQVRDGACHLDLPMSRRDIADALGLTIETVSRQLSKMRESGLLETVGRAGIVILQPERLRNHSGYSQPDT